MKNGVSDLENIAKLRKNPAISLSRILGMVFIILCHIIHYYPFVPGHMILGQFFNCGVHLFLFISGYLYGEKRVCNFMKWYAKRAITVVIPALILSFFVIIAFFIFGYSISFSTIVAYMMDAEGLLFLNWGFFANIFNEINSLGPLWFTTIIMLCYLLVPIWQKATYNRCNTHLLTFLVISIGVIIAIVLYDFVNVWYFYIFSVGFCLGKSKALERVNTTVFIISSFILLVLLLGRIGLHRYWDGTLLYVHYSSISQIIIGTWFVLFFFYFYNKKPEFLTIFASLSIIRKLEEYSFQVYIVHGVFCMGLFNLYMFFPLPIATVLFFLCSALSSIVLKSLSQIIQKPLLMIIGN